MLRVPSPAKLNLFLHIVGRRENGYHELQSIFQLIDLCDWFEFTLTEKDTIEIHGLDEVGLQDNLIYKAACLLQKHKKVPKGMHIKLEKNIPMGAGLGGGSSNAATTLLTLNHLWQCNLTQQQLSEYALQLGADVPFFILGQNAWVEGVGEYLTAISLPQKQYILLKPDCFISTQHLFSQKNLTRDTKKTKFSDYQNQAFNFINNFTPVVRELYTEVDNAMKYLEQFSPAYLTGTGSCVFLEIDDTMDIDEIIKQAPCKAYKVNSLNISPVFNCLS